MDVYNEDFLAFWKALNNEAVKYIMAGGFATNLHGYQRVTNDMLPEIAITPYEERNFNGNNKLFGRTCK